MGGSSGSIGSPLGVRIACDSVGVPQTPQRLMPRIDRTCVPMSQNFSRFRWLCPAFEGRPCALVSVCTARKVCPVQLPQPDWSLLLLVPYFATLLHFVISTARMRACVCGYTWNSFLAKVEKVCCRILDTVHATTRPAARRDGNGGGKLTACGSSVSGCVY